MTPPRPAAHVYLHREQADRWLAGDPSPATAAALDGDDVFHVGSGAGPTDHGGVRVGCRLTLVRQRPDATAVEALRVAWHADAACHLGIAIWPGNDGPEGIAEVLRGERAGAANLHIVAVRAELGARARGLIETDALAGCTVAVVGLGSGGSIIALALAQAGVGGMVLIDHDRLEVSNIARHVCGLNDLGRYKTLAMRDVLRGKNPYLRIATHEIDIIAESAALDRAIAAADLLIAATDSDQSRFVLNQAALRLGITALFGRALARASAGDVLRVRPHLGPCLACVFTRQYLENRPREVAGLREAQEAMPAYTSARDIEAVVQVGLASDIAPIGNMIVRLALVELSRGRGGGLGSLDADLTSDFYTWANRREGSFAGLPPMGTYVDRMSILRWYGAAIGRRADCEACGLSEAPVDDFFRA